MNYSEKYNNKNLKKNLIRNECFVFESLIALQQFEKYDVNSGKYKKELKDAYDLIKEYFTSKKFSHLNYKNLIEKSNIVVNFLKATFDCLGKENFIIDYKIKYNKGKKNVNKLKQEGFYWEHTKLQKRYLKNKFTIMQSYLALENFNDFDEESNNFKDEIKHLNEIILDYWHKKISTEISEKQLLDNSQKIVDSLMFFFSKVGEKNFIIYENGGVEYNRMYKIGEELKIYGINWKDKKLQKKYVNNINKLLNGDMNILKYEKKNAKQNSFKNEIDKYKNLKYKYQNILATTKLSEVEILEKSYEIVKRLDEIYDLLGRGNFISCEDGCLEYIEGYLSN